MPSDGSERSTDESGVVSRRRMLQLSAAAAVTGVAGCSGDTGEGDNTTTGGGTGGNTSTGGDGDTTTAGGGDPREDTAVTFLSSLPNRMTFNPWASNYPWTGSRMVCESTHYPYYNGNVEPMMLDDWSWDGENKQMTIKYGDDWYWWNGDQANAADKFYFERVAHLLNPAGGLESLELKDDRTLVRTYSNTKNESLVKYQLGGYLGALHRVHRDKFEPWVQDVQEASSQKERSSVQEQMVKEMPLKTQTVMDEGLGTGLYELTSFNSQEMVFEKFEDHPYASETNLPKFKFSIAEGQAIAQHIKNDDYDIGFGLLNEWVGDGVAPDHMETIAPHDSTYMTKLAIRQKGEASQHLRKRPVRQALAHVVNANNVTTNLSGEYSVIEQQTGLPPVLNQKWLGEDRLSNYHAYPAGSDTGTATSLMEGAGYSKEGGNWVDSDGNTITLEFPVQKWKTSAGKTIRDQLTQFGFEVNFMSLSGNNYSAKYEDDPSMDLALTSHGALTAHPYQYFRAFHSFGHRLADRGMATTVENWLEQGEERSAWNGRELTPEIPTEVGASDLSGETRTLNLYELQREWQTNISESRNQELAETFTWFWNFHLPQIDLYQSKSASWGDTQNFTFQNTDSHKWASYRASYKALRRGWVDAKTE